MGLKRASHAVYPPVPLWQFVEELVRKDWSPEQISGRLKAEHGTTISRETIYQYIYVDKKADEDLHTHLGCQKKRRKLTFPTPEAP